MSLKKKSSDVLHLEFSDGFSCSLRISRCPVNLFETSQLDQEEYNAVMDCAQCFVAEQDAIKYISAAEHSEFNLSRKLLKKGHSRQTVSRVCEYLKSQKILCDERFSAAFLRNRIINHNEGATRLVAELRKRGVASNVARSSVDRFFSEHDEKAFLEKELNKVRSRHLSREKILSHLVAKGFSLRDIREKIG